MKIGDTHVHSLFSTDSSTEMEEMVKKAVEEGLPHICFTDHIDYDYPVEGVEFDFNMDDYFASIRKLREKYREKILVLAGIELGMQEHLVDRYEELLKKYPFDFVIGSQHLVDGSDPYYPSTFDGRTDAQIYRDYFEEMLKDVRAFRGFDSLGHLDYIVRYGRFKTHSYSYPAYSDVIDEILKILVRRKQGSGNQYGRTEEAAGISESLPGCPEEIPGTGRNPDHGGIGFPQTVQHRFRL